MTTDAEALVRHPGMSTFLAPVGVPPDFTSAVAASAPERAGQALRAGQARPGPWTWASRQVQRVEGERSR